MSGDARQTRRAWAGAGIIVLLLGLGTFVFLLDDILARLRPTFTVVAVLREAPGVGPGSAVWVGGRPLGTVLEVGLLPTRDSLSRVGVSIELPAQLREQVRRDSRVRLTAERLIGEPILDILPGSPGAPMLRAGDTLQQAPRYDAAAVAARTRAFQLALDSALTELRAVQAPLQSRLASFQRVQLQLGRAQQEYARLMGDVRTSPGLALLGGGAQGSIQRSRATLQQLMDGMAGLRAKADESGATANAGALMASAAQLQGSLAALDSAMKARGGTLDRMARDSALADALVNARVALDSLIADAKARPFRYVF